MATLKKQYSFTNEPMPVDFGEGIKVHLRFEGFEVKGSNGMVVKPFEKHVQDFYKGFNAVGGRRQAQPSDKQRDEMLKEGLEEFLFSHAEGSDDGGDRAWFHGMLYPPKEGQPGFDPDYDAEVFFGDCLEAVRNRKLFQVERKPGSDPDALGK